jgi:predicted nucleic acid-binding protein
VIGPKMRKRLVIDANLLYSASRRDDPQAAASFAILNQVYLLCHRAVVNDALLAEWDTHSKATGQRWRVEMEKRGKVIRVQPAPHPLRAEMEAVFPDKKDREAVRKDLHLVELAAAADGVILSRDRKAPELIRTRATRGRRLAGLVWHDPLSDLDRTVRWLKAGAKREDAPGNLL